MDIPDILDKYGINYNLNARGWYECTCPVCSGVGYLGINKYGGTKCWRCGWSKSVETFKLLLGVSWNEAKEITKRLNPNEGGDYQVKEDKGTGEYRPPATIGPLCQQHLKYIRSRGLDSDYLKKVWGVRGIGIDEVYHNRLFLPVKVKGKPVSWTTRSVIPEIELRYLSAPADREVIPVKETLPGLDYVLGKVLVAEGLMSAYRVGKGCVATMGSTYTPAQVRLIARIPERFICLDAEPEAQAFARKLCGELSLFPGKTVNVQLDSGKDPGEVNEKELQQLRKLIKR